MSVKTDSALEFYKQGKYKEAIDVFSTILEHDEGNAEVYNNMGLCYAKLNDFEQAEKAYKKSIELNRAIPQAYINLSDLYYKHHDLGSAIGTLELGTYEMEDNLVLAHMLARVYLEDSRYDMAIVELEKVLDKEPENYDAYYDLGRVYFELGDYEDAISNFENVIEYKEDNEFLYYYLAQSYEGNNEIDKAISNHLKAISVNENFHPSYKKLGILFMARNDIESAVEYFNDYLNFDLPQDEKKNIEDLIKRISK